MAKAATVAARILIESPNVIAATRRTGFPAAQILEVWLQLPPIGPGRGEFTILKTPLLFGHVDVS